MGKAERFARFDHLVEQSDAVQVVLMESWLEDLPRCESLHTTPGNEVCSVEVTHIMRTVCRGSYQMCSNHIESLRTRKYHVCKYCGRDIFDCVTVIPV